MDERMLLDPFERAVPEAKEKAAWEKKRKQSPYYLVNEEAARLRNEKSSKKRCKKSPKTLARLRIAKIVRENMISVPRKAERAAVALKSEEFDLNLWKEDAEKCMKRMLSLPETSLMEEPSKKLLKSVEEEVKTLKRILPPRDLSSLTHKRKLETSEELPPKQQNWADVNEDEIFQRALKYMKPDDDDSLGIEVSKEMTESLNSHILKNVGRGFLSDEISSRLAAPLEMDTYCSGKPGVRFSEQSHGAAKIIQKAWRRLLFKYHIALTPVQKYARGMTTRVWFSRFLELRIQSAVKIQSIARLVLWKHALVQVKEAFSYKMCIEDLACWEIARLPGNEAISLAKQRAEEARQFGGKRLGKLLAQIQRVPRAALAKKRVVRLKKERGEQTIVALHMQRLGRGRLTRKSLGIRAAKMDVGFRAFQAIFRGFLARKYFKASLEKRNNASINMQRIFRGFLGRKTAQRSKAACNAATNLSSHVRGLFARVLVQEWRRRRKKAEQSRLRVEKAQVRRAAMEARQQFLRRKVAFAFLREMPRTCKRLVTSTSLDNAFDLVDSLGLDTLDCKQFALFLREIKIPMFKREVEDIFTSLDHFKEGFISKKSVFIWIEDVNNFPKRKLFRKSLQLRKTLRNITSLTLFLHIRRNAIVNLLEQDLESAKNMFRAKQPHDWWYHEFHC